MGNTTVHQESEAFKQGDFFPEKKGRGVASWQKKGNSGMKG